MQIAHNVYAVLARKRARRRLAWKPWGGSASPLSSRSASCWGVVVCKTIVEERGQRMLGQRQRYFFYVNDNFDISALSRIELPLPWLAKPGISGVLAPKG